MPTTLIICASLLESSFNHALLDVARKTLQVQGHKVIVSDLYKMNFNPVMSLMDNTKGPQNIKAYNYTTEMGIATSEGTLAPDIKAEQDKLMEADLVIFQFPLQAWSMPAIMQGWIERVLTENFVFRPYDGAICDQALLKGKRSVISMTTGGSAASMTPGGLLGDMRVIIWPMHFNLFFKSLPPLNANICYGVHSVSQQQREQYLADWATRLETIMDEEPLYFPKMTDYIEGDSTSLGKVLPEDMRRPGDESGEFGVTVGHNMGRKLPDN